MPRRDGAPPDPFEARVSPAAFSTYHFDWTPFPYQEEVMNAVLLEGKTRIAWVAGRRSGKTDTIANVALQYAIKKPGSRIAIFASAFRQAQHLSDRIRELLAGSGFERCVVRDNVRELRLRLGVTQRGKPRESVIYANALTPKSRGLGADMLILDESAFIDSELYRNTAFPFVANKPHGVVIHISTIWADDDHFSDALREYPKKATGAKFLTRTRDNPDVTPAMLEEFRSSMLDSEFRREYECELVADNGVFDRRVLAACLRDYERFDISTLGRLAPRRHHDYFLGVDWGKMQDRAVIAGVEVGTQEKANPAKLVFLQVYEPDPDNSNHYTRVIEDVKRVGDQLKAARIVADLGEGAHQAEVLEQHFGRKRFSGQRFTPASRDALVDRARWLVEKRALVLPREPDDVRKAFCNVFKTPEGHYGHASRQGKDLFDAVALALQGIGRAGTAPERPRMKLLRPSPGGRGWEGPLVGGPAPAVDVRRLVLPRELWHLVDWGRAVGQDEGGN